MLSGSVDACRRNTIWFTATWRRVSEHYHCMLGNQSLLLSRHKDLSGVTSIVKTTEALTYRPPLFSTIPYFVAARSHFISH